MLVGIRRASWRIIRAAAWALENLVSGNVVNQIKVPEHEAKLARIALDRMLKIS